MAQPKIQIKDGSGADKFLSSVLNQDGSQSAIQISKSFLQSVQMGEVEGFGVVDKFGANPAITTTSNPEDVVEQGGKQVYAGAGTAPILYLSTSDVSNTLTIPLKGLDINGNEVTQDVTMNGQNNVTLTTPLFRCDFLDNGDNDANFAGNVYVHSDPSPTNGVPATVSIAVMMSEANQRSLKGAYTIPKGKVGFLYRGELGIEATGNLGVIVDYARFLYKSRRYGKIFTTKKRVTVMVAQGSYQDERSFPDIIPALTDVVIEVQSVSANMGAWAAFDVLLVDETLFSSAFLTAIGQPS